MTPEQQAQFEAWRSGFQLFVLPIPEAADPQQLPEPPALRQGAQDARARIKRKFWRTFLLPDRLRVERVLIRKVRDPIPPERLKAIQEGMPGRHEQRFSEQPDAIAEAMRERTPQFVLRNLPRFEKDASLDSLFWENKILRELQHELKLDEIRMGKLYKKVDYLKEFSLEVVRSCAQERHELFHQRSWATLYFKGGRTLDRPWRDENLAAAARPAGR